MLNTIRADIYRLSRWRGFYITQGLLIALVLFVVATKGTLAIGISSSVRTEVVQTMEKVPWTGINMLIALSTMSSALIYFCLPLLAVLMGQDLGKKSYQNCLTVGISRTRYFFSKYLVFLSVALLEFIFYYGIAFLAATFKAGAGSAPSDFWFHFLRMVFIQFLSLQALLVIGILVLYVSFSNVAGNLAVILSGLLLTIPTVFLPKIQWVYYFSFQSLMDVAGNTNLGGTFWWQAGLVSFGVIVFCLTLALQVFKKKNL